MDNFYESVSVTIRNTPFFKAQKKATRLSCLKNLVEVEQI